MNSNDELCWVSWNTVYGRIKAERLLVSKRERGEQLNERFRFLIALQYAKLHRSKRGTDSDKIEFLTNDH